MKQRGTIILWVLFYDIGFCNRHQHNTQYNININNISLNTFNIN